MPEQMSFGANGEGLHPLERYVELSILRLKPECIQRQAAEERGKTYFVKQLFEAVIGLGRLDTPSSVAVPNVGILGFELLRING